MSPSTLVPVGSRVFKRIAHKPLSRGAISRKPPFANVRSSGHVELSASCCDQQDALARKTGLDPTAYSIGFGANEEGRQISIYAEPLDNPGSSGFVRNAKARRYSFSLAAVFAEVPTLRPATRRKCSVIATVDAQNTPCLVIALDSSIEFPVPPKKAKKNTSASGA